MTADDVLSLIRECRENSVRHIRIYGGERYEYFSRLEEELKDSGMTAEAVLEESVESERLVQMHEAGVTQFLVEIRSSAGEEAGWKTLSLLQELNISTVRAGWHMCAENAGELEALADRIKDLGITELVITGMCAESPGKTPPGREDIIKAAKFIKDFESAKDMTVTVDTCFSPLRAYMGGEDPKKNPNRGIIQGCEAGRSFLAVRADRKLTPCLKIAAEGEESTIAGFWEQSGMIVSIREKKKSTACRGCTYERRCRPCPETAKQETLCELK